MKVKQNDQEYNRYVEAITPKHSCFKNCLHAFLVGGCIDDIHGFALLDAVMIDDSAPETIIVHGFLLYAPRGLRYNTDMDCNG